MYRIAMTAAASVAVTTLLAAAGLATITHLLEPAAAGG